ncbi:MAG: hypothetical protein LBF97_03680 [Elusimicrobiota bacterium]|jgi:hypothetical protein|nr:hypothetical protein [Elusimicrobiota bacterium]
MKLTPENIFVSAKIKIAKKDLFVIKVNTKSFYACECLYKDFLEKQEQAKKVKMTFKDLCKKEGFKQYKYEDATIDETQDKPKIENKKKFLFSKINRLLLEDCYKKMIKNNMKTNNINNGDCQVVVCSIRDNILVISYNSNFYFYDINNHSEQLIQSVYEKGLTEKNVWEKLAV